MGDQLWLTQRAHYFWLFKLLKRIPCSKLVLFQRLTTNEVMLCVILLLIKRCFIIIHNLIKCVTVLSIAALFQILVGMLIMIVHYIAWDYIRLR